MALAETIEGTGVVPEVARASAPAFELSHSALHKVTVWMLEQPEATTQHRAVIAVYETLRHTSSSLEIADWLQAKDAEGHSRLYWSFAPGGPEKLVEDAREWALLT